MFTPGLCPLPHVASTVRVIDHSDRTEASTRLRTDEVLLTRQAREIASLSASITDLKAALAAGVAAETVHSGGDDVVRPIAHDSTIPEPTRIMPTERTSLSERPEIKLYVLPTVFSNNGSLIDVFA